MLISKVGYGLDRDLTLEDVTEVFKSKMGFEDHGAAPLAVVGRIKVAELVERGKGKIEDSLRPEIVRSLKKGSFVNNIFSRTRYGGDLKPLKEGLEEAVSLGSFTVKCWHESNQPGESKVLGYKWLKQEDTFGPRWKIHLGEVKRGVKCGVFLSLQNYEKELNKLFSKYMLLSLIAQLYDPIGFFTPLVLNLRNVLSILHQETKETLDEDADIPP